ncbi:MAG: dihydropteroate synthase [Pseudomonadota bacterium]
MAEKRRTAIMGVLNVTPDSFSDGGRFMDTGRRDTGRRDTGRVDVGRAVAHAERMVAEGADIIDVGGESTRPYSLPVSLDEELRRTIRVVTDLARGLPPGVEISVDTTKAEVARQALEAGARVINDVSALRSDPDMARVAAAVGARVVLVHMRGTPVDMQMAPVYHDVVAEVLSFLAERVDFATQAGIPRERLLIDPGIGFGKTLEHNLTLLRHVGRFKELGCPVLVGPSRKAFLEAACGARQGERDGATAACVALLVAAGVSVVRVHDVRRAGEAALLAEAIHGASGGKTPGGRAGRPC